MGSARQQAGVDGPSHKNGRLIGNSTVGVGQGLSEEEESRNNETDDVPRRAASAVQQAEVENQQQQGPVIQWEQFLPVKTLKVLLVESDDSTRQVVSALLRNCIYEVIPVENGNHAWQYLEDIQNRIDLVLAEVFTPSLSGIGLLDRIMSHNICKNIPVIMMSSNDSMGTVFKCLSKGAVDFLVKPIRKNELKNLWQHVWRRCHSSSGSGSESGIRTQKCKSRSGDESGNNSGSNDDDNDDNDDDDVSVGLNARDGSDNGSGTQSSWTKCAVEIDSPQPMSPDQLADPTDSTCAQVIHPKSEICSNRWLPAANKRNFEKHKEIKDDFREKDLEIGVSRNPSAYYKYSPNEMSVNPADKRCESMPQNNCTKEAMTENDGRNTLEEPTKQAADLIGSTAKNKDSQQAARTMDGPNCSSKIPEGKNKNPDGCIEIPSLELSLKRLRSDGGGATAIQDERNVLRRSDHSAFTRYHTSAASNQGGTGFGGSCSPHDNSSEAVKTDSTYNMKSNSGAAPIKQGSNGSSANNDMGSTNKNVITKPTANKEKVTSQSAVKASTHTSAFHPVQHCTSPANVAGKEKAEEAITRAVKVGHTREVQSNVVQHHHHIHHYVHHVIPQQQPSIDHKLSHENIGSAAPLCGSSNVFDPLVEGHAANYSQNGSNSGSNNGSNVQNGSTIAVNAGRPNMEIANCVMDKSGAGGGNGSGSGSGNEMYQKQLAQREAALNKFRQKRKERNFGKRCATKAGSGWLSSGHGSAGNSCDNLYKMRLAGKQQTDDPT